MCERVEKCSECGATALEACRHETKDDCARGTIECPSCGATTTEPCLEEV